MSQEHESPPADSAPTSIGTASTRRPTRSARRRAPDRSAPSPIALRPRTMHGVVGAADAWVHVFRELDRVVDVPCPVLLTGPHGSGKHTCARALHRASSPNGPFVFVDVATGSPSPAAAAKPGAGHVHRVSADSDPERWLDLAGSGTLFVSELTTLPPIAQLLLEDTLGRAQHRTGGFRLIVASELSMGALRLHPSVRQDFFYRVSILSCAVPPLHERGSDVLELAREFLRSAEPPRRTHDGHAHDDHAHDDHAHDDHAHDDHAHDGHGHLETLLDERPRRFSPAAERLLSSYHWPGNVAELRNVVEHAAAVAVGKTIRPTDLPSQLRSLSEPAPLSVVLPEEGIDLRSALDALESRLLQEALERTGWNKQRAARLLGLNRTTLVEMLKRKRLHRLETPR